MVSVLTQCIVYKATVTTGRTEQYYYGSVEGTFKKRWSNHNTSFKNVSYEHDTALSTFIWSLKDEGKEYDIQWEISKNQPLTSVEEDCAIFVWKKNFTS